MHDSTLYPPNCNWLGDDLVGQVIQRGGFPSNSSILIERASETNYSISPSTKASQCGPSVNAAYALNVFNDSKGKCRRHEGSSKHKRQRSKADAVSTTSQHIENSIDNEELTARKRRRENKARCRKKRRDKALAYEEDIRLLHKEIQSLERRHQLIASGVPVKSTVWNVVSGFFRLFRCGVKVPVHTTQSSSHHEQLEFLRTVMAPDVVCNAVCGVEALMKKLQCASNAFHDLEIRLVRLESDIDDVMTATTSTTSTITETMLWDLFPHLFNKEERWCHLATRLLGQRISVRGVTRFHWDDENEQVTRIVHEADVLTPLLRILGSLADVARVLASLCRRHINACM